MRQLLAFIVDDAHVQEHVRPALLRLQVELLLPSERPHASLQSCSAEPMFQCVEPHGSVWAATGCCQRTFGPEREPIGLVSVMPHKCKTVMPNLHMEQLHLVRRRNKSSSGG